MRILQIYEFDKGFALVLKISHFTLIFSHLSIILRRQNDHRMIEMSIKRRHTIVFFRSLIVLSFQNDKEMTNEDGMTDVTIYQSNLKIE